MPIEIKELIIKTTLLDPNDTGGGREQLNHFSEAEKEIVIAQCVDAVLKILRRREER